MVLPLKKKVKSKEELIPNEVIINIRWEKKKGRKGKAYLDIKPRYVEPEIVKDILLGTLEQVKTICREDEYEKRSPTYIS